VTRHAQRQLAGDPDRGLEAGVAEIARFSSAWMFYLTLVDALWRRARAESIAPALVVSHDLYGLMAGVRVKKQFGTRLLYDSHEFWPQADLLGSRWQERLNTRLERRLVQATDGVITVSPPLARHLERLYGLDGVLSVPNATPLEHTLPVRREIATNGKVVFLLQGQVAQGRGIDRLLRAWDTLDEPRAVLWIRAHKNSYLSLLKERFGAAIERGSVAIKEPVPESRLVEAAAEADVGVIPYIGPNLNHVYACPNKLSQYMQAGLPVLAASDMKYVAELLAKNKCGTAYDPDDPASLHARVKELVADAGLRASLSQAARRTTETSFNWAVVSRPYEALVRELVSG
jgi:glycosyltransferase involved in cell wall biosynthesis